jgi:hypothetical protein
MVLCQVARYGRVWRLPGEHAGTRAYTLTTIHAARTQSLFPR